MTSGARGGLCRCVSDHQNPGPPPLSRSVLELPSHTRGCGPSGTHLQYFVVFGLTGPAASRMLARRGCDVPPVAWGGRNLAVAGRNASSRPGRRIRLKFGGAGGSRRPSHLSSSSDKLGRRSRCQSRLAGRMEGNEREWKGMEGQGWSEQVGDGWRGRRESERVGWTRSECFQHSPLPAGHRLDSVPRRWHPTLTTSAYMM
jgi:hypothetical protein